MLAGALSLSNHIGAFHAAWEIGICLDDLGCLQTMAGAAARVELVADVGEATIADHDPAPGSTASKI